MSAIDDGGPAFPQAFKVLPGEKLPDGGIARFPHQFIMFGLSRRDYFAGMSLCGMSARDGFDPGQATPQQRARLAYIDADAMLAARKEGK